MGAWQHNREHNPAGAKPHSVASAFYAPPPEFDGCFTTFYRLEHDVAPGTTVVDYLQPEWANIRFFAKGPPTASIGDTQISGARFVTTGPSALACRFEIGPAAMWGIGLLPLGWARFMDADAHDLANIVCDGARHPAFARFNPLEAVLTDPEATIAEQHDHIIHTLRRLMRPSRDEAKISRVHTALVTGECANVNELASQCGMSMRTLERVCRRYFGFTPKRLMRRQRFMRSLTSFMLHQSACAKGAGPARWTGAMDAEYHDQAQFTREFREFMTMLPSQYAAMDHPILAAFMEARARIWGSAVQTLDAPDACAKGARDAAPK